MTETWGGYDLQKLHDAVLRALFATDQLMVQRTYNFLSTNAFLAAALALSSTRIGVAAVIASFGIVLSIYQVALGRRTERAILFFRRYLSLLEAQIGIPIDSALFNFYEYGSVILPGGRIIKESSDQLNMYDAPPWKWVRSTNVLVGVTLPWTICLFWAILLNVVVLRGEYIFVAPFVYLLVVALALESSRLAPAKPRELPDPPTATGKCE